MTREDVRREVAGWEPVTTGESGATVRRDPDGTRYAKAVPAGRRAELAAERDRIVWFAANGGPGPRLLDWCEDDEGALLLTGAVAGTPADQVPVADLRRAWPGIARAVRELHELPAAGCPFTRDLDMMIALARDVVARGVVNPDFLPDADRAVPGARLLERLEPELARRRAEERADTVVVHGDLCLPNLILEPGTLEVAGFVDLGRLGRADRHADLALLLATAAETWPGDGPPAGLARHYGRAPDPDRLRFHLALDPLTWG